MRYNVVLTDLARQDILDAHDHLAMESQEAADRLVDGLMEAAESLRSFPARCAIIPEDQAEFAEIIRQLLHSRYRILFAIKADTVTILHVRHTSRDRITAEDLHQG